MADGESALPADDKTSIGNPEGEVIMKKFAGIVGLAAGATMLLTAGAFALDSNFDTMSKAGKHQFYVWCTGKADYVESADGSNAKDAQAKIAAKAGNNCWPVWQGMEG